MLQTDQKPLQAILSKSLVEATPQMQRLLLPTIPYDMTVEYIKGETSFIADCLSRVPIAEDTIKLPILQVNQITAHTRCTQDKIDRLQQSTVKDDTLVLLKNCTAWLATSHHRIATRVASLLDFQGRDFN